MKILCLYNNPCAEKMFDALREMGHETVLWSERLDALGRNVVNIHHSMLPWNRGADPNIWSFVDNTPRGVTLHYMDEQPDKGFIIAQKRVFDTDEETFASGYDNLDRAAVELMCEMMPLYSQWETMKRPAEGKGSYHSVADGRALKELIPSYDMKIKDFRSLLAKREEKPRLFIRADANEKIGTGHVMRCMSVAAAAKKLGADVTFLVADKKSEEFVTAKGCAAVCLDSRWDDLEQELPKLLQFLDSEGVKALLVDSYSVTDAYFRALGEKAEVTYIDDVHAFPYAVKRLINYNFYGPQVGYEYPSDGEMLLGTEYVPLREEFFGMKKRTFSGLDRILITSGGTDPYHVIDHFLERLLGESEFAGCEFYCVLGRYQTDRETLEEKYGAKSNVHLLSNVNNMSHYMLLCDAVVTAGGSTTYEICACGLPGVIYTFADNQSEIAESADALGILAYVGDLREGMAACEDRLVNALKTLKCEENWQAVSSRMQQLVDGRGAERIARSVLHIKD